jgi:1-acyl-sn-glycerol-3-phosphate acyltransferase
MKHFQQQSAEDERDGETRGQGDAETPHLVSASPCLPVPVSSFIPHPSFMLHLLGRFWLWLFGWKIRGETPTYRKFVLIAAPHTSNLDFPFMLATAYAMRVRISWFGKHTLFIPPWGWFMRKLGGIPVDRRAPHTLVMQMAEQFKNSEDLVLAVPPEGTRSKVDVWKSGFYHIASESGVPIGLGYLDYERKLCGVGMFVMPSENVNEDMNKIRSFYRDIRGKHPKLESEPRLREETD